MRFTMERLMFIWIFSSGPKACDVGINPVSF
nr:MAG TPA: hypothetical protein [Siphoviridae sp. ctnoo6]